MRSAGAFEVEVAVVDGAAERGEVAEEVEGLRVGRAVVAGWDEPATDTRLDCPPDAVLGVAEGGRVVDGGRVGCAVAADFTGEDALAAA